MKILFLFWLVPKDILGRGFVDYETNIFIIASLLNLNSNSTKPSPKILLGISRNDQFQTMYQRGDLVIYSFLGFSIILLFPHLK